MKAITYGYPEIKKKKINDNSKKTELKQQTFWNKEHWKIKSYFFCCFNYGFVLFLVSVFKYSLYILCTCTYLKCSNFLNSQMIWFSCRKSLGIHKTTTRTNNVTDTSSTKFSYISVCGSIISQLQSKSQQVLFVCVSFCRN